MQGGLADQPPEYLIRMEEVLMARDQAQENEAARVRAKSRRPGGRI